MKRVVLALTARRVRDALHPGGRAAAVRLHDGAGLYLQLTAGGGRSWLLRYRDASGERHFGLGSAHSIGLAEARRLADAARVRLRAGVDLIADRAGAKAARDLAQLRTFKSVAETCIAGKLNSWSNPRHATQWTSTLAKHVYPMLGTRPVNSIVRSDIEAVLTPIWDSTPETARRVRSRIETVLAYATVQGYREGDNPAVWRGNLKVSMPVQAKTGRHHAALPWRQVAVFGDALRKQPGVAASALWFAILTAARSGEVRGMTWDEIDMDEAAWTVPASRMKMKRAHRVPLSAQAMIVVQAQPGRTGLVFPGTRPDQPLSDMTLTAVIRRMQGTVKPLPWSDAGRCVTAHGFRASFRTWCEEATPFPLNIAEAALAHSGGSKTVVAYARGELFDKRREMMGAWGDYCTGM